MGLSDEDCNATSMMFATALLQNLFLQKRLAMSRLSLGLILLLGITSAHAHELPDGEIERRVQIVVKADCVLVEYSLAMNQVTLAKELRKNGVNPVKDFSQKWNQYRDLILPLLAKQLYLELDGKPLQLKPVSADYAGWSHRHLTALMRANVTLAEQSKTISVLDTNFPDALGNYRIAMKARSGVSLENSNVPLLTSRARSVQLCKMAKVEREAATRAAGEISVKVTPDSEDEGLFPDELVNFTPHPDNPIFTGTGTETWDRKIRERGYILKDGERWHLWYTGYSGERSAKKMLGYATSSDGLTWKRHPANPVFGESWTEDVHVVRHGDRYYMVAEGRDDIPHMLNSIDGINWTDQGRLDVRNQDGSPISPGPYGTPTLWIEDGTWYLFYERRDEAVWLATSTDRKTWTNIQDDPVLTRGPSAYDRHAIALNQVIRLRGRYYAIYHANADEKRQGPWTTCVAVSDDLIRWKKYSGNPIIRTNDSSGQLIHDGRQFRLYTMHPDVKVFFSRVD